MQAGSLKVVKDRHGVKVWRAQWRENGRGRTKLLGTFADVTRAAARAELDKILAPLNSRANVANSTGPTTLRKYVEIEYLRVKSQVWKSSTAATTEQIIGTHILIELGNRALTSITRRDLQDLLNGKAEAGLSFSVVAHVRFQLQAVFAMAEGDGLVTVNPTKGLVTPRCKEQGEKITVAIPDIVRAQLVLGIRDRLIFRLAVCEGMRPGEILGLKVADVAPDGIHISRRVYRGRIDTPKSKRSKRIIPPTATTTALIETYLGIVPDTAAEAWLFPSEKGTTTVSYSNVYRRTMQPALKSIGLGHVNFQVLRRTWVTEFSAAEDDSALRAKLAGHSVNVHENDYRQPKPEELKRAMNKLGDRLQ